MQIHHADMKIITVKPATPQAKSLHEAARFLHTVIPVGDGGHLVHNITYYGDSRARTASGWAFLNNERRLRSLFTLATQLGEVPVIMAGDFNTNPDASPVLKAIIATGEWHDLGPLFGDAKPTYFDDEEARAAGKGSRIDLIIANTTAEMAAMDFTRPYMPAYMPVANHSAIAATFEINTFQQIILRPQVPKQFELSFLPHYYEVAAMEIANKVWEKKAERFRTALDSLKDPFIPAEDRQHISDTLFHHWSQGLSSYFKLATTDAGQVFDDKIIKNPPATFKTVKIAAPTLKRRPHYGAVTRQLLGRAKFHRQLEELATKLTKMATAIAPMSDKALEHLNNLQYNVSHGAHKHSVTVDITNLASVNAAVAQLNDQINIDASSRAQRRIQRWNRKMQDNYDGGRKKTLKERLNRSDDFTDIEARRFKRDDDTYTCNIQEMHEMATTTWGGIFNVLETMTNILTGQTTMQPCIHLSHEHRSSCRKSTHSS